MGKLVSDAYQGLIHTGIQTRVDPTTCTYTSSVHAVLVCFTLVPQGTTLCFYCVSHYHARKALRPPPAIPIRSLSDGVWFAVGERECACSAADTAAASITATLVLPGLFTSTNLLPQAAGPVFFSDPTHVPGMRLADGRSEL